VEGADALYARVDPIAREVDGLKGEYEALLAALRRVIEEGAKTEGASDDAKLVLAERAKALIQRGQWLCARIEERYLSMYALEEELKAAWVEKQKEMQPEVRDEALVFARDGFRFEPLLARKQIELAALDLDPAAALPGEKGLLRKRISSEIEVTRLERSVALSKANVRSIEAKIAEIKESDPYVRRLFEEDLRRAQAAVNQYAARQRIARTEVEEINGLLDGTWDANKIRVTQERERARTDLERALLEDKRVDIDEEIRWAEGEEQSDDPARRAEAKKKLEELRKQKSEVESRLKN